MHTRSLRRLAALLLLCASFSLNGCLKKSKGEAAPLPLPGAPAPAAQPADISKNGAVLVFPRPLTGPITINLGRK